MSEIPAPVTAPAPGDAEPAWTRLHPLTPLLRGGRVLLLLVGLATSQGLRDRPPLPALLSFVVLGTLLAGAAGYVSWRATRYRVARGELQVDSGVLVRRTRRVPLARVQSVDVVRPVVGRLLGLAELRLEVVGGGDTEAPLAYLSEADARALRGRLLRGGAEEDAGEGARAGGEDAGVPAPPPEQVLVRVPTSALVTSVLLGAPVGLVAVAVPLAVVVALVDVRALGPLVAAGFPAALGVAGVVVRRLLTDYGSTVSAVPEGLRLRSGLLETRSQTVPPGRVQTVRILEPLLWRRRGWVRVEVDVAGYGGGREEQQQSGALLPVAPRAVAELVLARVLGGPVPPAVHRVPDRARYRIPLSARRTRVGLDDVHLSASTGVLTTTTDVVPLAKVQSLRLLDGPWQRRLRLATIVADTAGRRLPAAVLRHRDAQEAAGLLEELGRRTRAARRAAAAAERGGEPAGRRAGQQAEQQTGQQAGPQAGREAGPQSGVRPGPDPH